ncbi:MAG: histidinol-phosphate aminotransferase family protein [Silvanigrellales bacterium]|nr:histidinol-phosphate aminotransferase family protein [Silvanigrellales bacterium]
MTRRDMFTPAALAAHEYMLFEPAGAGRLHQNEGAPLPSERQNEIAEVVARALRDDRTLHCYPSLRSDRLYAAYAKFLGVPEGNLEITAGSSMGIALLSLGCFAAGRRVAIVTPSFSIYEHYARLQGCEVLPIPLDARMAYRKESLFSPAVLDADVVLVCTPNNPTGGLLPAAWARELCDRARGLVVVDEAYIEFATEAESLAPEAQHRENLVVLRTLSKAWGLAGLRLGALVSSEANAKVFRALKPPYAFSFLSEVVGAHVLEHWGDILDQRVKYTRLARAQMESVLLSFAHAGVETFESHANFVCFRHRSVREWERVLREDDNLLIRVYGSAGPLANVARVSVWSEEANARFLARLPALLNEEKR